jgi:hypothetical protein
VVVVSEAERPLRNRFSFRIDTITAVQICNGYSYMHRKRQFPNGHKAQVSVRSGVTVIGYVTAVAAGKSQRFYSGVGIFNWYYLSSTPRELRI